MGFSEQTKEAAKRLANSLTMQHGGQPSVFSVGITEEYGTPILIVHLNRPNIQLSVPTEWEGFPVRTEYIGRVRPLSRKKRFG
jgi:hypothetical protein